MSRAGDPALMHEVLDLLKAAHIKVSFTLPPLFEAKFLPAEDVAFDSSIRAALTSATEVKFSNLQHAGQLFRDFIICTTRGRQAGLRFCRFERTSFCADFPRSLPGLAANGR